MKRRWKIALLLAALAVLAFLVLGGKVLFDAHRRAARVRLERQLDTTILPHVDLRESTFADSVDYLLREGKKRGLDQWVGFRVMSDAESEAIFKRRIYDPAQPLVPDPDAAVSTAIAGKQLITVSLTEIPVREAFKYVAGLAGYSTRYLTTHNAILFFPEFAGEGTFEPLVTERFIVPEDFFGPEVNEAPRLPNGNLDVQALLPVIGLLHYEGTSAELNAKAGRLTIVNTQEQIDWLLGSGMVSETNFLERMSTWIQEQISNLNAPPPLPAPPLNSNPPGGIPGL